VSFFSLSPVISGLTESYSLNYRVVVTTNQSINSFYPKFADRSNCSVCLSRWIIIQLNLAGPLMHVGGSIAFEVSHVYGLRVANVLFLPLTR
jgi:hypothetical protein